MSNPSTEALPKAGLVFQHHHFAAGCFSIAMLAGAWQVAQSVVKVEWDKLPNTVLDFREGRLTGTLEKKIDHQMPLRPTLIAYANAGRYMITGGGGDQVRIGEDNWLFLTEELRFEKDAQAHLNARVDMLASAAQQLKAQGIPLVIALVPDKARIYAQHLGYASYPDFNASRYSQSLDLLRKKGVPTVDLLTALSQGAAQNEVYYRTDTHWNQEGGSIAAKAIANEVKKLAIDAEITTFQTLETGPRTERPGDIIRLMSLDTVPAALRPRSDFEVPVATRQSSKDASGGLFGEASVPIVLIGTSYSMRGNFAGYLQEALSLKVLNAAKEGGGFLQAATTYFGDDSFKQNKPKLIVWEVPERFLYSKLEKENTWVQDVGLTQK
ncbi:alginate O-acetyltransferase AlgX-related protein [Rhodoferax aquaticus]|uniref:Cell division protein FtsQ n=1 Tax=Rhodoferax aquaticus TaxID=2527691 RepID=A0A515EKA5_9BURK|nr:cell division protein FtsQ [Rhodoferax aquaticus]QDL53092.1 cell division protein FtsQ [Rhodoferax aquaticus]